MGFELKIWHAFEALAKSLESLVRAEVETAAASIPLAQEVECNLGEMGTVHRQLL